jgi:hypothetical protein
MRSAGDTEIILFTFPQPMEMSEYGQPSARSGYLLGACMLWGEVGMSAR